MEINLITPCSSPIPNETDQREVELGNIETIRNNKPNDKEMVHKSEDDQLNSKRSFDQTSSVVSSTYNEVVEVPNKSRKRVCIIIPAIDKSSDDEVEIIGQIGDSATTTFPHYRYYCGHFSKPFHKCTKEETVKICSQCYCYPCDKPAKDCDNWIQHCEATDNSYWKKIRDNLKKSKSCSLSELKGDIILDQVCTRLHSSVMNAPLENGYSLHIKTYKHKKMK